MSVDHLAFVRYHKYSSMKIKTQRPLETEEYKMIKTSTYLFSNQRNQLQ